MMMASTMNPTNPTPAHLSAFLNLKKNLLGRDGNRHNRIVPLQVQSGVLHTPD